MVKYTGYLIDLLPKKKHYLSSQIPQHMTIWNLHSTRMHSHPSHLSHLQLKEFGTVYFTNQKGTCTGFLQEES